MQKQQETATTRQDRCNVQGPCAYIFDSGNTGSWRLERPKVDYDACIKCGTCAMYCPANVITVDKEKRNVSKSCGITVRGAESAPMNVPDIALP